MKWSTYQDEILLMQKPSPDDEPNRSYEFWNVRKTMNRQSITITHCLKFTKMSNLFSNLSALIHLETGKMMTRLLIDQIALIP